jgi:hypothetical protein
MSLAAAGRRHKLLISMAWFKGKSIQNNYVVKFTAIISTKQK